MKKIEALNRIISNLRNFQSSLSTFKKDTYKRDISMKSRNIVL